MVSWPVLASWLGLQCRQASQAAVFLPNSISQLSQMYFSTVQCSAAQENGRHGSHCSSLLGAAMPVVDWPTSEVFFHSQAGKSVKFLPVADWPASEVLASCRLADQ